MDDKDRRYKTYQNLGSGMRRFRANWIRKYQNGLCPECGNTITAAESVADHDHATGMIRDMVHVQCNFAPSRRTVVSFEMELMRNDLLTLAVPWRGQELAYPTKPYPTRMGYRRN